MSSMGGVGRVMPHSLRVPRSASTGDATVRVSVNTANKLRPNDDWAQLRCGLGELTPCADLKNRPTGRQQLLCMHPRITALAVPKACRAFLVVLPPRRKSSSILRCSHRSASTYQFGPGTVDLGLTRGGRRNKNGCAPPPADRPEKRPSTAPTRGITPGAVNQALKRTLLQGWLRLDSIPGAPRHTKWKEAKRRAERRKNKRVEGKTPSQESETRQGSKREYHLN